MANISITPLNLGGIQAPTNLLASLIAPALDNKNLMYPIDLASNPVYGHAVQFTICEYTTTAQQLATSIQNSGQAPLDMAATAAQNTPTILNPTS